MSSGISSGSEAAGEVEDESEGEGEIDFLASAEMFW